MEGVLPLWGSFAFVFPTEWVASLPARGDAGEGVSYIWGSFAFTFPTEWVASRGVLPYMLLSFRQGRKQLLSTPWASGLDRAERLKRNGGRVITKRQSWAKLLRSLTVNSLSYFVKIKY